jgi:hypothetical protein
MSSFIVTASRFSTTASGPEQEARPNVFRQDPRLRPFHIDIELRDGIVTLRGTVETLEIKTVAEDDARNVVGVWQVRNLISPLRFLKVTFVECIL